jgi:hypothetical protein
MPRTMPSESSQVPVRAKMSHRLDCSRCSTPGYSNVEDRTTIAFAELLEREFGGYRLRVTLDDGVRLDQRFYRGASAKSMETKFVGDVGSGCAP